jgi:hypothetical protein
MLCMQMIADRVRDGLQTDDDLAMLTARRRQFPDFQADFGINYDNETCARYNWEQTWNDCKVSDPPCRLYVCKASYHTTPDNQTVVEGLASLRSTVFSYAADVLAISIGASVRLIRNVNVGAGLVNSALGKVVKVVYDNADVQALMNSKHPPPYMIVVDFPGFLGFADPSNPSDGSRIYPFPDHPTFVPIYRSKFVPAKRDLPKWISLKQTTSDCYRMQFPIDLAR